MRSGRFTASAEQFAERFTESVSFDQRLYAEDIAGSTAHVNMLAETGVISQEEARQISDALQAIQQDIEAGRFSWSSSLEDVHMNIETELVRRIGDTGKKLHAGRSRNDQVATDLRLYLRRECADIRGRLHTLIAVLLDIAEEHKTVIMPGFTHLQIAQPINFGHHLLAWCEMLLRDRARLADAARRMDRLPLGAAALAGTSLPIQRGDVARALGFQGLARNSLDAVSDRDFVIEFTAAASILMMHLSRFSEELILWMSEPFSFIDLGDAWCTGSSLMPQKKNPDIPELVRGKTGRVYGDLVALLTIMKAQPLAYNRDNQEDKPALFDAVDTVRDCLQAYTGMLGTLVVNRERMYELAGRGFSTATDLADYLVQKGIAFREAHGLVGQIVRKALAQGKQLHEFTLTELQAFSSHITEDVFSVLTVESSVAARTHPGGTAPEQVAAALQAIREQLQKEKEEEEESCSGQ